MSSNPIIKRERTESEEARTLSDLAAYSESQASQSGTKRVKTEQSESSIKHEQSDEQNEPKGIKSEPLESVSQSEAGDSKRPTYDFKIFASPPNPFTNNHLVRIAVSSTNWGACVVGPDHCERIAQATIDAQQYVNNRNSGSARNSLDSLHRCLLEWLADPDTKSRLLPESLDAEIKTYATWDETRKAYALWSCIPSWSTVNGMLTMSNVQAYREALGVKERPSSEPTRMLENPHGDDHTGMSDGELGEQLHGALPLSDKFSPAFPYKS